MLPVIKTRNPNDRPLLQLDPTPDATTFQVRVQTPLSHPPKPLR